MSYIHNYEEDFGIINPFNNSDTVPVFDYRGCSSAVGRINIYIDQKKTKLFCVQDMELVLMTLFKKQWIIPIDEQESLLS